MCSFSTQNLDFKTAAIRVCFHNVQEFWKPFSSKNGGKTNSWQHVYVWARVV